MWLYLQWLQSAGPIKTHLRFEKSRRGNRPQPVVVIMFIGSISMFIMCIVIIIIVIIIVIIIIIIVVIISLCAY